MKTYFRLHRYSYGEHKNKEKAEARWWAWQEVEDIIRSGDKSSVDLIIALSEAAKTEEEFAYLGAGPFEDVFKSENPPIDLMESALRTFPNVRYAFQFTWLHALPTEIAERLARYHHNPKAE